jgi:hypothetical protein
MTTDQIIQDLLDIRGMLFMWNMSLEKVDGLLRHLDYPVATLPQYPKHAETGDGWQGGEEPESCL